MELQQNCVSTFNSDCQNKPSVISYKAKYSAFFIISSLAGIAVSVLSCRSAAEFSAQYVFRGCTDFSDFASASLSYMKSDLIQMIIMLFAGLSVICAPVSIMIISFRGFSAGFCTAYLYLFRSDIDSLLPDSALIIIYTAVTVMIIIHASENTDFSVKITSRDCKNKSALSHGEIFAHIKKFAVICGTIILLNLISAFVTRFI